MVKAMASDKETRVRTWFACPKLNPIAVLFAIPTWRLSCICFIVSLKCYPMDELKFSFPTEFDVLFQIQNFFPRHVIVICFGFVPSSVGGEIWNLICIVFWKKRRQTFWKRTIR